METQKFIRTPFTIDAVQVTDTNMPKIAEWCDGTVHWPPQSAADVVRPAAFVKVKVHRPLNEKQTQAFVGDWVLFANRGFKVYTDRAFHDNFDPVFVETQQDASFRDEPTSGTSQKTDVVQCPGVYPDGPCQNNMADFACSNNRGYCLDHCGCQEGAH